MMQDEVCILQFFTVDGMLGFACFYFNLASEQRNAVEAIVD
jgi:hypothetical protein